MDQGSCGSSYAFAIAAAATDRLYRVQALGQPPTLSPQEILDCQTATFSPDGDPCKGGYLDKSAELVNDRGLPTTMDNLDGGCLSYKYRDHAPPPLAKTFGQCPVRRLCHDLTRLVVFM